MAETPAFLSQKRYAVVTGANKGIGLEVCRQLASQGVVVVLTSIDEKRGLAALENLKQSGLINPENLEFHQLDVTDPTSVASLADFVKTKFGKVDILVNNAGVIGATIDYQALVLSGFFEKPLKEQVSFAEKFPQTYEPARDCLKTNYYGVKRTTEALLPLLELSDSPRIVNVSSGLGRLSGIPSEQIREVLGKAENLTEDRVDKLLNDFLEDVKDGSFVDKGWPPVLPAYIVSKATLNAYTRILAKKYPSIIINCVCPGFVKTDINQSTGILPPDEGGARTVRVALLPHLSPSGFFYSDNIVSPF